MSLAETYTATFDSVEMLFAHAIAMEREAAERYAELGERSRDLGYDLVGELFLRLAQVEKGHGLELERRAVGLRLPVIGQDEFAWIDQGAPESAAHNLVLSLLTCNAVLQLALAAERRAKAFFEAAYEGATHPAVAAMAREMADEEDEHIAMVQKLIDHSPGPGVNWGALGE